MPRGRKAVTAKTEEKPKKKTKEKEVVCKEVKKKPIGFKIPDEHQKKIETTFETLQEKFNEFSEELNTYVYDGKKKSAAVSRGFLMEVIKTAKDLRIAIQESKTELEPIYKDAA